MRTQCSLQSGGYTGWNVAIQECPVMIYYATWPHCHFAYTCSCESIGTCEAVLQSTLLHAISNVQCLGFYKCSTCPCPHLPFPLFLSKQFSHPLEYFTALFLIFCSFWKSITQWQGIVNKAKLVAESWCIFQRNYIYIPHLTEELILCVWNKVYTEVFIAS